MRNKALFVLLIASLLLCACVEKPQDKPKVSDSEVKESLEKANRFLVNEEEEDINNYVARHQLNMVSTGTGMRYQILQAGKGEQIQPGQTVTMEYVLDNIMGDEIYSSDNEGLITAVVGCGDVVSGLDEALRHLHQGDVAKIIVPSHLGYGLLGDQKSIPARATLIYTIKILKVVN